MDKSKAEIQKEEVAKQRKIHQMIMEDTREFKSQFIKRSLELVTSGFGLVAALAWNGLITEIINVYIKPYLGNNSGIISLAIYAIFVTALAVFITYQLSKLNKESSGG